MRPFALLPAILCFGCDSEVNWPGGTGVGNPGTTKNQLARAEDIDLDRATGVLDHVRIERCDDIPAVITVGIEIDLLNDDEFQVPGGRWCALDLVWSTPLSIEGAGHEAGAFRLELEVDTVHIPIDRYRVDEDALIVELGYHEWLTREMLGLEQQSFVLVDITHPLHDNLAGAIAEGSALFVDENHNGIIDGNERESPAGVGDSRGEEEDD